MDLSIHWLRCQGSSPGSCSNLTADSFLLSFREFTAQKGFPHKMISDYGTTFKAAAKSVQTLLNYSNEQQYSADVGMDWSFKLTLRIKAP